MLEKYKRLIRHADALIRYWSFSKIINLASAELNYRRGADKIKSMPYIYVIDPTNFCNLKCEFCPTWKGELPIPKGKINQEDYFRIIDKIKRYAFKVILYNWGEPFLHPDIIDLIDYTHKAKIASTLSSNMNYLPDGLEENIVRAGLDHLVLSVNGISEESYLKYHKGGDFKRVIENIRRITEAKKRLKSRTPHVEFQFLVFKHNQHEIEKLPQFAHELGCDSYRLSAPFIDTTRKAEFLSDNPNYVLDRYKPAGERSAAKLGRCFWIWRAMVINWNGDVDPCCGKNSHGAFGNILKDDLNLIWNNKYYQSARRVVSGQSKPEDDMTACHYCQGYDY